MRTYAIFSLLLASMLLVGGLGAGNIHGPAEGGWPMYGGDPTGSSQSQYKAVDNPKERRMLTEELGGNTEGAPVTSPDGTLYLPLSTSVISMKDRVLWSYDISGDNIPHISEPAIAKNGDIYFAVDTEAKLYSLYPNGSLNWTVSLDDKQPAGPVVLAEDGSIYFGAGFTLYSVSPYGSINWKHSFNSYVIGRPVIYGDELYVVISNTGGMDSYPHLYAMNRLSGNIDWVWESPYRYIERSPALTTRTGDRNLEYMVLLVAKDGYPSNNAYMMGVYSNGTVFSERIGKDSGSSPAVDRNTGYFYASSYDDGAGDHKGHLYSFYPNGTIRWYVNLTGTPMSPVLDNRGNIYMLVSSSCGRKLMAFGMDGEELWNVSAGQGAYVPVIGPDGKIYVSGYECAQLLIVGEGSESSGDADNSGGNGDEQGGNDGGGTDTDGGNGDDSGNDSENTSSTPGFGSVSLLSAMVVVLSIYWRRKK